MKRRTKGVSLHSRSVAMALAAAMLAPAMAYGGDQFMKPTKEELSMTSLPGYPGASAVVLFREQITRDDLHVVQHYDRIKILTEDGKKFANVELPFFSTQTDGDDYGDDKTVGEIVGRTVHADGTIIPFTGKPYLKMIEKGRDFKEQERIFTLPDVEVGSIIEYRYNTRIADNIFESPSWYIQGDLYVKSAHYVWYPTQHELTGPNGNIINSIAWYPILPKDAKLENHEIPASGPTNGPQRVYELSVKDVPPLDDEEYMPPIKAFSYRVLFSFTEFRSGDEYWKATGKRWSKNLNSFAGPNGDLQAATQKIIAGATSDEEKLHRIYDKVMSLENTRFTRAHDQREDKAAGLGQVKNASDVLTRGRGTPTQLTWLFIGMARAAGFKAYGVLTPDRSIELVTPAWLDTRQFDDEIAIVNLGGKEVFFDPGSRYCEFGRLEWQHSDIPVALRQTDEGTTFGETASYPYTVNKTSRVANLTMDDHGQITGRIDLTYLGAPALHWRQTALKGDEESLHHGLETSLRHMLPKSVEVKVTTIQNLTDYNKPLIVSFETKGTLGTATGKRVMMPADLFLVGDTAHFPHEKRSQPVYFHYPEVVQDALRVNLPSNLSPEAVPTEGKYSIDKVAFYDLNVVQTPKNFTTRRNFAFNGLIVPTADYAGLRTFYTQLESKDQESVVLKTQTATASAPAAEAPAAAPSARGTTTVSSN